MKRKLQLLSIILLQNYLVDCISLNHPDLAQKDHIFISDPVLTEQEYITVFILVLYANKETPTINISNDDNLADQFKMIWEDSPVVRIASLKGKPEYIQNIINKTLDCILIYIKLKKLNIQYNYIATELSEFRTCDSPQALYDRIFSMQTNKKSNKKDFIRTKLSHVGALFVLSNQNDSRKFKINIMLSNMNINCVSGSSPNTLGMKAYTRSDLSQIATVRMRKMFSKNRIKFKKHSSSSIKTGREIFKKIDELKEPLRLVCGDDRTTSTPVNSPSKIKPNKSLLHMVNEVDDEYKSSAQSHMPSNEENKDGNNEGFLDECNKMVWETRNIQNRSIEISFTRREIDMGSPECDEDMMLYSDIEEIGIRRGNTMNMDSPNDTRDIFVSKIDLGEPKVDIAIDPTISILEDINIDKLSCSNLEDIVLVDEESFDNSNGSDQSVSINVVNLAPDSNMRFCRVRYCALLGGIICIMSFILYIVVIVYTIVK